MPRITITKQDWSLLEFVNTPPADGRFVELGSDFWFPSVEKAVDTLFKTVFSFPVPPFDEKTLYEEADRERMEIRKKLHADSQAITESLFDFHWELREMLEQCLREKRIPSQVQQELNERFRRCPQIFDFESGAVRPDLDLESGEHADFDLRVLAAPAIARFLYRYCDRLGRCEYKGRKGVCGQFFVAKRKGRKTLCDKHTKARAATKYRATHKEELKRKAREYREKYPISALVQRKRRK